MKAQPHVFALVKIHRIGGLTPLPQGSPCDRSGNIQVPQQLLGRSKGNRFHFLELAPGAEEKLRVFEHSLSDRGKSRAPGRVEFAHLLSGELMPGDRFGETLAVLALGARHRHQILHSRMSSNLPATNSLLDGIGQLTNERQATRDPGHAPVEPPSKIVQTESKAAMKLGKQPTLFKRRLSFGCAQGSVQHKRLGFVHVPNRSSYRVVAKALQRPYSLVAVDNQESVGFFRQSNDHDGNLLAPFGERSQQSPLTLRAANAQSLIT
jgi:hypothetical protein